LSLTFRQQHPGRLHSYCMRYSRDSLGSAGKVQALVCQAQSGWR
jgi:hypothetical protein